MYFTQCIPPNSITIKTSGAKEHLMLRARMKNIMFFVISFWAASRLTYMGEPDP